MAQNYQILNLNMFWRINLHTQLSYGHYTSQAALKGTPPRQEQKDFVGAQFHWLLLLTTTAFGLGRKEKTSPS